MRKYCIVLTIAILSFANAFSQTTSFTAPDSVCINSPFTITNTSVGASSYFWNFCVADVNTPPIGTDMGNLSGNFSSPVFMDYALDNGNYYGFVTNNYNGTLTRLDFGNSLLNTPTSVSLGNVGGVIPEAVEGIQVVKNNGSWFAIIVGGRNTAANNSPRILKIDFGASLNNPAPTATNWGNIGNLAYPVDLHLFQSGANWYGLTINADNNTITRFSFTNSFNNTPTAVNLGNIGSLDFPTGIYAINDNGDWYTFITNEASISGNPSITRLDFGNSLLNTPVATNLGNPNNVLSRPRDLTILKLCGQITAFAVNATGDLVKLDFNNNLLSIPTGVSFGNIGSLNFPHSISRIFREGGDLYAFTTNVLSNALTRFRFVGCSNSSIGNSSAQTPPTISYNTAGTYNINLTVDDGLPTQSTFCKQIVVLNPPKITQYPDPSICPGNSAPLNVQVEGATIFNWTPSTGLSATNIANPVATPSSTTDYTFTSSNGGCSATENIKVSVLAPGNCVTPFAGFNAPDTVCVNSPVTLTNTSNLATSYFWNFCVANVNTPPVGTNLGNLGSNFASPVFMDYAFDNGIYYGFVTNNNNGVLTKLTFGNSLLNTPTSTSLGNIGNLIPISAEGIQIVKNNGKWYAIIVGGLGTATNNTPRIVRIDFGTSLNNPSPTASNWGNIGNLAYPVDLHLFQSGSDWYGFTLNADNNTITRFNFGNSFDNTPTAVNLGNIGQLDFPTGIYAINDNGNWHVFITNEASISGNPSITRLDFGGSLLNIPIATNLGNPNSVLRRPRDLTILKFCDQITAFVVNADGNTLSKLDFHNDLSSTPSGVSFGNIGSLNFPHSISRIFREGSDLYSFTTNVLSNSLSKFRFVGCTNSNIANSSVQTPTPVTYNTPGTYNINLTIDDGLPSQSTFCKQVVVLPKPATIPLTDTSICPGTSANLHAYVTDATLYKWSPDTYLSAYDITNPIATPAGTITYTFTVSNAGCSATDDMEVKVLTAAECAPAVPVFSAPDTVCVNSPVNIVDASTNVKSYSWNFCVADLNTVPTGQDLGNIGNQLTWPVYMDYAFENGNYYAFVVNHLPAGLLRLDFGNSLLNTPVTTNLGNPGNALKMAPQGIQIVQEKGKWYAFVVGGDPNFGSTPHIAKLEFGSSLTNTPTGTDWGNVGNLNYPHDLFMFKEGNDWFGFTVNYYGNSITRFSFGNDFSVPPAVSTFANIAGLDHPTGICPINDNGIWRIFVANHIGNSISRIDFGNSLLNNPTFSTNLGNPGNLLNRPIDLHIFKFCDKITGFIINDNTGPNIISRLNFTSLSAPPTITALPNTGGISTPHSITRVFREGSNFHAFLSNTYISTISRVTFSGNCSSVSLPSYDLASPPPVTYSTPGTYSINLTVNEGLTSQESFCKQVVVLPQPTIIPLSEMSVCPGMPAYLDMQVTDATTYLWTPDTDLSASNIANPVATPALTTTYTLTASNAACSASESVKVIVLPAGQCTPDPCDPTFQKLYGGSKADYATGIIHNADGTSVIAGYTSSFGRGGSDGYLQKIDKKGNEIWSVAIGGTGNETFQSISTTNDGGYIMAGNTTSYGGSSNGIAWIVKVDANGTLQWSRKYDDGNADGSIALDVIQTSDNGYAITGTNQYRAGPANAMVIKTDNNGTVQWAKSFDSGSSDQSYGVVEEADSLVISAFQNGQGSSLYNGVIMKLSRANGNIGWARNYDIDNKSNWFSKIYKTSSGYRINVYNDVVFALNTPEQIVINTDKKGNPQGLYKILGSQSRYVGAYAPTSDGGFVVVQTDKNTNGDIHFIKASMAGNVEWARKYAGTGVQSINEIRQLVDGSYIMVGYNNSTPAINDSSDIYIIKTNKDGDMLNCPAGVTDATITMPGYTVNPSYVWATLGNINFLPIFITTTSTLASPNKRILCEGPVPLPDFTFTQEICNPKSVQFAASDAVNQLVWEFGDGTGASNVLSPAVIYNNYGVYLVKLKVITPGGCADSIIKQISVNIKNDSAIITRDTVLCFNGDFKLNSLKGLKYCWEPSPYLSATDIPDPVISAPIPRTTFYLNALITGNNLITNGDFSQGNTGFVSNYLYSPGSGYNAGVYTVRADVLPWHPTMVACSDHTGLANGNGNMMLLNGSSVPNDKVWSKTIIVTPNTNYAFSTWLQSISPTFPAKLQFYINGKLIDNPFNATTTSCEWLQFYSVWNSGTSTTAEIAIVNQNTDPGGNDFALDDISFSMLQMIRDSVTVTINANPEADFTFSNPLCKEVQVTGIAINASAGIAEWNWNFGDHLTGSGSPLTHNYLKGGDYDIRLIATDANTCKDTVYKSIKLDTMLIDFSFAQNICNPESVQFNNESVGYQSISWDFGNGNVSTDENPVVIFDPYKIYPIKLEAVSLGGCTDNIIKFVPVLLRNDSIITTRDTILCFNGDFKLNALTALKYCWQASPYLSSTDIQYPVITGPIPKTTFHVNAITTGKSLIVNGDFSQGNTGFTSDYSYTAINLTEGEYYVGNSSLSWNPNMAGCSDHTGNGNMLLVNGNTIENAEVWKATIAVLPNTNYAFSTWVEALHNSNPANLQFSINDKVIGDPITAALPTCTWKQFYTIWNSGTATTAEISIVNKNTLVAGNDFALDDIAFGELMIIHDSVTVTINANPEIDFNYSTPFCKEIQVTGLIVNAPAPIATWDWAFGDTRTTTGSPAKHTYQKGGPYEIRLIAADINTCKDTVYKTVQMDTVLIDFSFEQDICNPKSVQFINESIGYSSINWDFDNGTVSIDEKPLVLFSVYKTYAIQLKAVALSGCKDSIIKAIPVLLRNDSLITMRDTVLCFNGDFRLNAGKALKYCWEASPDLSATDIQFPVITGPIPKTTFHVNALSTGKNLIINGDFSQGNSGFMSNYLYSPASGYNAGVYTVRADILPWHPTMSDCKDHTGNGMMMLLNGSSVTDEKVWTQTVNITPNTSYAFSTWLQSISPTFPAKLQFYINGKLIGEPFNATNTSCEWKEFYSLWNSGASTTAEIAIVNQNTFPGGNDFALDDISFGELQVIHDSITVTINPNPVVDFNYSIPYCKQLQLSGVGINVPNPIINWSWNFGDDKTGQANTLTHNYIKGGIYPVRLIATDINSCKDTLSKLIQLDTITALISPDTLVCKEAIITLRGSGGTIYQWTPSAAISNAGTANPQVTVVNTTRYHLKVINGIGCEDTASVLISVKAVPAWVKPPEAILCKDSTIQLKGSNGNLHYYQWSPAVTLNDAQAMNPMAKPIDNTSYRVTITEVPCNYDTTFEIRVQINPNPTVTASKQRDIDCINPTTPLYATGTGSKYLWTPQAAVDFPSGDTVRASVDSTTMFVVKNTNEFNCSAYDSVIVKVTNTAQPVFGMPNGFTPNGDGINDCYGIKHWGNVVIHELSIYNRWGERVFTTKNPKDCWDGTYKGQLQPNGGFIYIIKAKSFCGEIVRKGNLVLIR